MANDGRYTPMLLFDAFEEALGRLVDEDAFLFLQAKAKASIAHCLAMHLQQALVKALCPPSEPAMLPEAMKIDIQTKLASAYADVLVHDRKGNGKLGILIENDYLDKTGREQLSRLHEVGCALSLAVSFLPGKKYVLIYRNTDQVLDYYHFSKQQGTSRMLMQRDIGAVDETLQLTLGIRKRKKRVKPNR